MRRIYRDTSLTVVPSLVTYGCESKSRSKGRRREIQPADGASAVFKPEAAGRLGKETAVERREAPRARSRRFAQADRSVARAAPEARASGNIRSRGAAHDIGASRRCTPRLRSGENFLNVA